MSDQEHEVPSVVEDGVHFLRTQLVNIVCLILFILGLFGNLLGLLIFSSSRRTWRISSTYVCLATCSSLTNLLCIIRFASLLHSTSKHFLHHLVAHTWWACKIYELSFSFRVIASWITLFWMFERLLCISKRLRQLVSCWNSPQCKWLTLPLILSVVLACVVGPPVYMFEPNIISRNAAVNSSMLTMHCKVHQNASAGWVKYFTDLHFGMNHYTIRCTLSELFPAGAIILFDVLILHHLRTYRRFHRAHDEPPSRTQSETVSWMNTVLILHSFLFLFSLSAHVIGHFIAFEAHEVWWVQLMILINCSLNFYVYCLSGEAFRSRIRCFMHWFKKQLLRKLPKNWRQRRDIYHNPQHLDLIREIKPFPVADPPK